MKAQENDPLRFARRLRAVVMACSICAAGFILFGRLPETRQTVITYHYLGLGTLFIFLTLGELCHLSIVWLLHYRNPSWRLIARLAYLWRLLTDFIPGTAALIIFSSGLRLIYEGHHSLRLTWLFILVFGFGFLFVDGLVSYTPIIASLHALGMRIHEATARTELQSLVRSSSFNLMLLLHFTSLPLLYLVGRRKLLPTIPLLYRIITAIDSSLFSLTGRMTGVVTALILIALESLIVIFFRRRTRLNLGASWIWKW
jgi:hypothetical protein